MSKKVNRKVPKLRFSEFEESWDLKKLRNISSLSSGATPLRSNSSYFDNANIPWVKTTDLNNSEILKTEECISDVAIRETSARKNPVGSVLIAMYGGFNQIGRTGLLKIEAATNQAITVVIPKTEINSYFLLHFLNRNVGKWRRFAASSRKDPNITSKDIGDFIISFSSIAEQEKIASFLGAIDTRLTQLRRKHELLQTYKRGVMQKLFSQQIRFKCDDGKPFLDWEKADLGEVLDYEQPTNYLVSNTEYNDLFPTPVLTAGKTFLLGFSNETDNIFSKLPTIIFDDFTTAFKFVDFPFKAKSSAMKMLVPKNENVNMKYIFEVMSTLKFSLGEEHKRYWISEYQYLKIPYPEKEEQEKIADFLTAIDKKIEAVAKQIELTEQFKKGLLQKMFV